MGWPYFINFALEKRNCKVKVNPVTSHISYLLLTCREVSVEGLGTFSLYFEKASFHKDLNLFYPSRLRVLFTSQSESSSSMLQKSLQRQMKISKEEASRLIQDFVESVNIRLYKSKYCKIEGLGYLINKGKNNISLKDTFWKVCRYSTINAISI